MVVLVAICTFFCVMDGALTLGCDNETAVYLSSDDWLKISLSTAHVDLIWAIQQTIKALPIKVHLEHVYGHQDDHLLFYELPRLSQLNTMMDTRAK